MKIKGSELSLWVAEGWPGDDWYWDHGEFDAEPDPARTYDTELLGGILWQGSASDPSDGEGLDLGALIRKWRKARTNDVITVLIPKGHTESLRLVIAELGGRVL